MKKLKNISVVLLLVVIGSNAHAQVVNKGSFIAGLNVSGQNYGSIDSSLNWKPGNLKLNFSPYISYAYAKNQTVGAYLLLNNSNGSNFNFGKYNHDFAVGIFTRRYFQITKKVYVYGQGDLQYAFLGNRYNNGKFTSTTFNMNLSAGIGYKINNKWLLEAGFNNLVTASFTKTNDRPFNGQASQIKFNEINFRNVTERNGFHIGLSYRFR
jgi:hypothetical protein